MATETSPTAPPTTTEQPLNDGDSSDELQEMVFSKRGCCFWVPCFRSDQSPPATTSSSSSPSPSIWWERIRTAEKEEKWWARGWKAFKKIREWSELVAGPRWKTFIRRFNKNRRSNTKFQYDPLSYSLNFDEGPGQNGQFEDDYVYRDFSTRFASIPASAKSSMDLGKDGPSFI